MTLGISDVASWRRTFVESVQELSSSFLCGVPVAEVGHKQQMPDDLLGAFVQVVCPEGAVLLGITGTSESCAGLAKLMLGMDPEDEISEDDSNDAMGEIINIAAGTLKTKLSSQVGNIELGLPLFLSGRLRAVGHIAVELTEVEIGPHACALIVFALTGK
ncbi:MAG: chemotaxis protein CheX [Polyangiaceae bacterium]